MLAPVRFDRNFFCRFGDLILPTCTRREGRSRFTAKLYFCFALILFGVPATHAYASPVTLPGVTAVGSTSAVQTVSVVVTANGQLGKVSALTGGVANLDFAISGAGSCLTGSTLVVGQTCSFPVTFSPKYPGQHIGAVALFDASGLPLGDTWLVATGGGPLALFIPGIISTVAGDVSWIYRGDGQPATSSPIFLPFGVAVDPAGNMFIADSSNNRIRRVDAGTQLMSTYAGNGSAGNSGDGGLATLASVSLPTSVALDGAGNLYFADSNNHAIRRVSAATGVITTIAGVLGAQGYSGDGGLAIHAHLDTPDSVAIDPAKGYLYIADSGNNLIRRVDLSTGIISVFAGNRVAAYAGDGGPAVGASLNGPWGVTVGPDGQIYIADQNNHSVRKVALDGTISTIAGNGTSGFAGDGGPASAAVLDSPAATAIDAAGNIYIADAGNNRVRKVNAVTGEIDTVVGSNQESFSGDGGPATGAGMYGPYGMALDGSGNLYVSDVFHNRIRLVKSINAVLNFPTIRVQRVSATQDEELENDGNAPLNISSLNPGVNTQLDPVATTCSTSVAMASALNCIIGAQFAPTVIGNTVTGTIIVTSDSPTSPQTITLSGKVLTLDPSTITLNTSGSPSATGALVTFTVAVTSTGVTPTGIVTFLDGAATIGTATLNSAGVALFPTQSLASGTHIITASYAGDSNTAPGTSTSVTQIVKDGTSVALSSSLNPSSPQVSVTFSALVVGTSGVPTGSVRFLDGGVLLGTVNLDATGAASFSTSTLSVTTHRITASYSGDANSIASTSNTVNQIVVASSTATTLTTSNPDVSFGTAVTFTANVTGSGSVTPTGTISFQEGTTVLGTLTLDIHGAAALTLSTLSVAAHSIRAVYGGDANNGASSSAPVQETIEQINTTTAVTSNASTAPAGSSIQLNATITPKSSVPSSPITGTVTFMDGTTTLGAATVSGGTVTITLNSLAVGQHTIFAIYGGSSIYAGSISTTIVQKVQQAVTSGTLIASANPSIAGKSDTLTVSITSNGGVPTGVVTFMDGTTVLGTAALNAQGVASFTVPSFSTGTHSITAVYGGDNNNLGTTPSLTLTVQQATTGVVLSTSGSPSTAGLPVTLSATVTGNGSAPTGSVTFYDGSAALGSSPINAAGLGTISLSTLTVGPHTLTAAYSGDAYNGTSTSPAITQVVVKATTTTTLTASASTTPVGAPVTFTATVAGSSGALSGTVQFMDGSTVIGSPSLAANGTAVLSISTLIVGQHIITAVYLGDTNDAGSTSAGLTHIVSPVTGVALASSQNPVSAGANVTFTAAVGGSEPAPTGVVTFHDGSATLAAVTLNAAGVAVFNTTSLALGTHIITASYGGDANNNAALSLPLSESVQRATTQTSMAVSAVTSTVNSTETLTVTVTGSGGIPGGQVTFLDGTAVIGTAILSANGSASLSVSNLSLGQHTLSASYGGDTNDAASSSPAQTITVNKGAPGLTLVSSSNPSIAGLQVVFTANLSGTTVAPTGSVTFTDGTTVLGSSPIAANGSANFSTSSLSVGQHTIVATYTGDANNSAASSPGVVETIQPSTSTVTLSSNKNPALIGDAVTFAMTVSGTGSQPTGTVILRDGANSIGTTAIGASGLATLTVSNLTIGAHTLIATYNGDSSHPGSVSGPLLQTILQPTASTLISSSNPSLSGTPVTFTTVVSSSGGSPVTGSVTFRDGAVILGTSIVGASGTSTFTTNALSPGQHSIVATYSGDSVSQTSSSPVLVQTVQNSGTTTVLTTSGTPSIAGAPLTLTAQVTGKGAAPAGPVSFEDGTTVIGTASVGVNGIATLTTSSLAAGQHILLAIYEGDSNTLTSTSNPVLQNIEQRTVVALTAVSSLGTISGTSSGGALIGNPITFTASVTGSSTTPPTGLVTLSDGSTILGTASVNGSGLATFSVSTLALGPHTLTATYAGDTQNFPGTSPELTEVVLLHTSKNTLTISSSPVIENQPFTLVATLQGDAAVPPSGTVVFSSGGKTLGSATLNASGIATLTTTLGLGTYTPIATYQGDSQYLGSVSSAVSLTVIQATNFTISLNPPAMQLKTTQHNTIQLTLTSIQNFTDVLSLGCVGLPRAATCTFTSDQVSLDANGHQTISLTIDTGSPLTAGSIAKADEPSASRIALCFLPGGLILGLSLLRSRRAGKLLSGLLLALLFTGAMAITGCGGLDVHGTPAGTYTFNVTAIGAKTAVTQSAPMTLTVTQ
ncbi:Ig-like domain repeat protein [Tunturiibacter empetritectus]|uniref:Sugar lactone lactonase YvrE n=1 Tax=Tunturiibacter lichenicola TaxID=2051959 RepID=A0A852VNR1_9BACT|nr:Ig-like domain repeat protein [Edaphobacter lichenicola]NYF91012.1 sugar lactone lactonase YvrE [Edaphobacter lichenicola]